MGDRANIYVKNTEDSGVYLYSHWSGTELPMILREALRKRWRWDDDAYLARIIFDTMVDKHQGEETSFGISTRMPDNEYPLLVVDCDRQTVSVAAEDSPNEPLASWTMAEFIALDDKACATCRDAAKARR